MLGEDHRARQRERVFGADLRQLGETRHRGFERGGVAVFDLGIADPAIVPIELGDAAENFAPSALDLFTVDGVLYGMPYAVENLAFFRNTDLVPEAPATWDEVFTITEEVVGGGA
ncbi:MAG: extracellular solute-binding protein, partial [Thermoanaerobaculia bacterium]|nr:extracellular solute-binding protein [Thermoanaerobaculia bacterium]